MEVSTLLIKELPPYPNARLPVLVYAQAEPDKPDFASLFRRNGFEGIWTNGIYSFHHFHATAHEALGCISGWAQILLGGPEGTLINVRKGDALLLPAGVAHKLVKASDDFRIVGAYPPGQSPDLQRGEGDITRIKQSISKLPLPRTDPVTGTQGAVHTHWHN